MKSLTSLLLAAFVCSVATAKVTSTFTQTYPLTAEGHIRIESVNGTVEISGWEKNEVSLVAEKIAPNQEELDRMEIKIDAKSDRFSLKTERKKQGMFGNNWRGEVRYRLQVPSHAKLEKVNVVNATVTVRRVQGTVDIQTVNGEVNVQGLTSNGRFESVNGSFEIGYVQLSQVKDIAIETVNGSCRLLLPANPNFQIEGKTVNGGVHCDFPVTIEKSGRGHFIAHVGDSGPRVTFEAVNGDLKVATK